MTTRTTDYSETRACLRRARAALTDVHRAVGRTNLPPSAKPGAVRGQIDALEAMVAEVSAEIDAARAACTREGRHGLTIV